MRKTSTLWLVGVLSALVTSSAPTAAYVHTYKEQEKTQQEVLNLNSKVVSLQAELVKTKSSLDTEKQEKEQLQAQLGRVNDELKKKTDQANSLQSQVQNQSLSSRSGSSFSGDSNYAVFVARATAYDSNGGGINGTGITATGTKCTPGRTIAVDPNVIPLGSVIRVDCPDYPQINGEYIAEDTGGAIKGNRLDIAMGSENACFSFGVREVRVSILKKGGS